MNFDRSGCIILPVSSERIIFWMKTGSDMQFLF